MKSLFSTEGIHPRNRFDYWHEVACKSIVGHDSRPRDRPTFEAALKCVEVAEMQIIEFENSPMHFSRTPRNIAHSPDDFVLICQQIAGQMELDQNGRQVLLPAGEITIIDPRRPYVGQFVSKSRTMVFKVPWRALGARLGRNFDVGGRVVKQDDPIGALTSANLAVLSQHAGLIGTASARLLGEHTLDLIALSFSSAMPTRSAARSLALANLRAFIEMRLSDPALDPSSAAAGSSISVRYANGLLAEEGTSLLRHIQARRLERCERALANLHDHRSVSEIAFAWGFTDLTHFGRLFKKRFGMSPREYRRTTCRS